MTDKRTLEDSAMDGHNDDGAKRAKLEGKTGETALPIPTDGSLRPGDIRVVPDPDDEDSRSSYALGVHEERFYWYPVREAGQYAFEECDGDLAERDAQSIPLNEIAFVQRLENSDAFSGDALERYRLVAISPSDEGEGDAQPRSEIFELSEFETSFYYFPAELDTLPNEHRNFRTWLAHHAPSVRFLDASDLTPVPLSERYHLTVVLNSNSGAGKAKESWEVVEELLKLATGGADLYGYDDESERVESWLTCSLVQTLGESDGERVRNFMRATSHAEKKQALLVFGGDGTLHDLVNGLLSVDEDGNVSRVALDLVLHPSGTANALYYSLFPPSSPSYPSTGPLASLYSILSFLEHASPAVSAPLAKTSHPFSGTFHRRAALPLPVALNTLPAPYFSTTPAKQIFTTVVTSAALHASILHDAEALRASHPGVERFKLAAQQNADRWWSGSLRLEGAVKRYDSTSKSWIDKVEMVNLSGEFAYVTAALVDRFESTFVPAPFRSALSPLSPSSSAVSSSAHPAGDGSIDLVLIRPLRHAPTAALVREGQEVEAKKAFVERVWAVSGKMYEEGSHVDLVYAEEEREDKSEEGKEVVEIYRCGGFEWAPAESAADDLKSRLVCLDGAVHDLSSDLGAGEGVGKLTTRALGGNETGLAVWA